MYFFKVQFKNSIKKIQLRPEELKWDDLVTLLVKSFHLLQREQIKLTYKDAEGDDISVKNEDDLLEAIRLSQNSQMLKLYLECAARDQALMQQSNIKSIETSQSEQTLANVIKSTQTKAEDAGCLQISFEEIQPVFDEILSRPEIINILQKAIANHPNMPKELKNVKINCANSQFLDYFNKKISDLARNLLPNNEETEQLYGEFSASIVKKKSIIDDKGLQEQNEHSDKNDIQQCFKSIHDVELIESIYEPITRSTIEQSKSVSKNENVVIDSSSLVDSSGFRFILKFENGKHQFVAVPVSSLNSDKSNKDANSQGR